jgi:hypothetical protein
MNARQAVVRAKKINRKYLNMRAELWPDVDDEMLWNRKENDGFITIPRAMPYILYIMDTMTVGKPISSVYFSLWCRVYDQSFIIINDTNVMALEAGFATQRGLTAWNSRMKLLVELGFIDAKAGASGNYHYVLLLNPYKVLRKHYDQNKIPKNAYYNALVERVTSIGAEF